MALRGVKGHGSQKGFNEMYLTLDLINNYLKFSDLYSTSQGGDSNPGWACGASLEDPPRQGHRRET